MGEPKKLSQQYWVMITLVGLVSFAALFYLVSILPVQVTLSSSTYFFLLILLALVATAFLAGAMKSVAKYNANIGNRNLMIAGPAVIFFVILYIGYRYRPIPKSEALSLQIMVMGPGKENELITDGSLTVYIGNFSATEKINTKGIAAFTGINNTYADEIIRIVPAVQNYSLDTSQSFRFDPSKSSTQLQLILEKVKPIIVVRGNVSHLSNGEAIPGALVRFDGVDTVFRSDEEGNFRAQLPLINGSETRVMITLKGKTIYNSLRTLSNNALLSFPVEQ